MFMRKLQTQDIKGFSALGLLSWPPVWDQDSKIVALIGFTLVITPLLHRALNRDQTDEQETAMKGKKDKV